jgi:Leucine-rich repeat (LRR) protein
MTMITLPVQERNALSQLMLKEWMDTPDAKENSRKEYKQQINNRIDSLLTQENPVWDLSFRFEDFDTSCKLRSFPTKIFQLLTNLTQVNLSGHQIQHLALFNAPKLQHIIISDSNLKTIVLTNLVALQTLSLAANELVSVDFSTSLPALEWLDIEENPDLTSLPDNLMTLCPNLLMLCSSQTRIPREIPKAVQLRRNALLYSRATNLPST